MPHEQPPKRSYTKSNALNVAVDRLVEIRGFLKRNEIGNNANNEKILSVCENQDCALLKLAECTKM